MTKETAIDLYKKANKLSYNRKHEEAAPLYEQSAIKGYRKAQYYLGHLYLFGIGVPRNVKKAFGWIQKAAKQGHPEAQDLLKINIFKN